MKEIYILLNKLFNVKYTDSQWVKFAKIWNLLNVDLDFIEFENLNHVEFDENIKQIIETALLNNEQPISIENGKLKINFPIKKLEQILNEAD